MIGRLALGACGVLLAGWGALNLLDRPGTLLNVGLWLAGGTLAHDFLLVPVTLLAGVLIRQITPARLRPPVVQALLIIGALTILAVPVLGRFGAKPDNPTLLDRPYWSGWAILCGCVVVGCAAAAVYAAVRRRHRGATTQPRPGDRGSHGEIARDD